MDKKTKIIIAVLVLMIVAIIVFLCSTYAKDFLGKTNSNDNTIQAMNETTEVVENKVEVVENTIEENTVQEPVVEEPEETEEPEEEVQEENSEVQDGNYEQNAIEIVKKDMGNADGLSFQVEDNGNGSYDVCVRDENSRAVAWYTVWPKTGKFTK